MAWYADSKRIEYCRDCPKRGLECDECSWGKPPELMEINRDAFDLWVEVKTQWRSGFGGLIGLDYVAVNQEAGRMGIDLDVCLMSKIKVLESMVKRIGMDSDE